MIIEHNGVEYGLIGDPHLGRTFKTGVPLHRRGERESQVWAAFVEALRQPCEVSVNLGDLFDTPAVERSIVAAAIDLYRSEAAAHPYRMYVVLAGNHDRSRQPGVVSSFDLFQRGLLGVPNVRVLTKPHLFGVVLYVPWVWGADLRATDYPAGATLAFVHLDLEVFGHDESCLVPARALTSLGVEEIWGGHWHIPGDYMVDGVTVHCAGSLLPYSHSEDPDGRVYVTLTPEEALARDDLHMKCVRILAKRGEDIPDIDCLALTVKWQDEAAVEIEQICGSYDLHEAMSRAFTNHEVPDFVRTFVMERT